MLPPPTRPRSSPAIRRALAALLLALASATSRPAQAGEAEWVVSPALGYGVVKADGRPRHGASLAVDVDYGLTDSWSLRGSAHYEGLALSGPAAGDAGDLALFSQLGVGIGALYVFDVLQVVPYVSLTVGGAACGGGALPWRWNAEARIGLGADWLVRRDFSVGLELRYGLLLPDYDRFPYAITAVLRLAWRQP